MWCTGRERNGEEICLLDKPVESLIYPRRVVKEKAGDGVHLSAVGQGKHPFHRHAVHSEDT